MEFRVLNEIRFFAEKYGFTSIINAINDIGDLDDLREATVNIINKLYTEVLRSFDLSKVDVQSQEVLDDAEHASELRDNLIDAIRYNPAYVYETKLFLNNEKELLSKYSSKMVLYRKKNSGKLNEKLSVNGKKALITGGIVVTVSALSLLGLHLYKENKNADKEIPTTPTTQEDEYISRGNGGIVAKDENKTSETIYRDVDEAAADLYASVIKITDKYSKEDLKEVIKALNGLDASISIDEADEVLCDIINIVAAPRINNLLNKTPYTAVKLNLNALVLNRDDYVTYVLSDAGQMQKYFNSLMEEEDIKIVVKDYLTDVLMYLEKDHSKENPVERIIYSRLVIHMNAMSGTLSDNYTIDYNDNTYKLSELLEIDAYDDIAIDAKNQISGYTL